MHEKLNIITNYKKTILFVEKIVINYPNTYLTLKNKIMDNLYSTLELLYFTNTLNDKTIYQKQIVSKLKMLDFYILTSLNNKLISNKKYIAITSYLIDITKMIYSWMNEKN